MSESLFPTCDICNKTKKSVRIHLQKFSAPTRKVNTDPEGNGLAIYTVIHEEQQFTLHSYQLCKKCARKYALCAKCHKHTRRKHAKKSGDHYLCAICETTHTFCGDCNSTISHKDVKTITGSKTQLCIECYRKKVFLCGNCGAEKPTAKRYEIISRREMTEKSLCHNCFVHLTCNKCNYIPNQASVSYRFDTNNSCTECERVGVERGKAIKSYATKPRPRIYGIADTLQYIRTPIPIYGIELEVSTEKGIHSNSGIAESIDAAINAQPYQYIYIKSDGTIPQGFEIVTQPMTLKFLQENSLVDQIYEKAKEMEIISHDTGCCGMHIHVPKIIFTNGDIYKISNIIYHNRTFIELIGRRSATSHSQYRRCETVDNYTNPKEHLKKYSQFAVRKHTCEFRCFRGTIIPQTIRASAEFCDMMISFVKSHSLSYLKKHNFEVTSQLIIYTRRYRKTYRNLYRYMIKQKIIERTTMHRTTPERQKELITSIRNDPKLIEV